MSQSRGGIIRLQQGLRSSQHFLINPFCSPCQVGIFFLVLLAATPFTPSRSQVPLIGYTRAPFFISSSWCSRCLPNRLGVSIAALSTPVLKLAFLLLSRPRDRQCRCSKTKVPRRGWIKPPLAGPSPFGPKNAAFMI